MYRLCCRGRAATKESQQSSLGVSPAIITEQVSLLIIIIFLYFIILLHEKNNTEIAATNNRGAYRGQASNKHFDRVRPNRGAEAEVKPKLIVVDSALKKFLKKGADSRLEFALCTYTRTI
jgi:hypothetical protein